MNADFQQEQAGETQRRYVPLFPWLPPVKCFALCSLLALSGCKSIGPGRVPGDRFDYSAAISDSWKRQTLLNIVKLRYMDPPVFVDVGQIVASRTLSGSVSLSGTTLSPGNNNALNLGGAGTYTDQPTITYTPLTGNKYIKSLLTPLTPESVFYMIQAGWPADGVLFMAASVINGLKNQEASIKGSSPPSPDFLRALELLRKIQLSGGVAYRIQEDAQKQHPSLLTFPRQDISPETLADSAELRRLLRLNPDARDFTLVFGSTASTDKEVAVQTRSIIQLMGIMAAEVEVPAEDLAEHSAAPGWESMPGATDSKRLIRIHSSKTISPYAFVAVPYQDHWFWIDRRDLDSKRVFTFMMMMFSLADTGEGQAMPLITIPAH
jgi:hypothetical protein